MTSPLTTTTEETVMPAKKKKVYLSPAQRAEVCALYANGDTTCAELGKAFNVSESGIARIIRACKKAPKPTHNPLDPRLLALATDIAALTARAESIGVGLTVTTRWL